MTDRPIRRVLVAVDFGESSAAALRAAASIAARHDAALTVLHAETLEAPPYFTEGQVDLLERTRRAARAAAEAHVRTFARAATSRPVAAVVADGSPAAAIVGQAGDHDLIVLGTHGRRGAARWWLGSVAEDVIRTATVPVLVVPPDCGDPAGVLDRAIRSSAADLPRAMERLRTERRSVLFVPAVHGD
ncbi:MAG: universal stress protein [Acidobacteria bacterium]|nr:universal stress protein [Acidobacteriota bacterium]